MDNADIAQELIEHRLQQAMLARRQAAARQGPPAVECEDCGKEIPAARRERLPGVTTCVPCQTAREGRR